MQGVGQQQEVWCASPSSRAQQSKLLAGAHPRSSTCWGRPNGVPPAGTMLMPPPKKCSMPPTTTAVCQMASICGAQGVGVGVWGS